MIEFVKGDFFDFDADIRVNTVNCVGVMGAGVALIFKSKFPQMFEAYVKACEQRKVQIGIPHVWHGQDIFSQQPITIINFPTKDHWKQPSKYEYIEKGLIWLKNYLLDKGNITITMPALGCGHGGLEWDKVKQMIIEYLEDSPARILTFEPTSSIAEENSGEILKILEQNHVSKISPNDFNYPKNLKGKSAVELYIKGDKDVLNSKILTVIVDTKANDKEKEAVFKCIKNFPENNNSIVYLLNYNSGFEIDVIKDFLLKNVKLIILVPYGILSLKIRRDLKPLWDEKKITLISIAKPKQTWKVNESISALKFRFKISDAILIANYDYNSLEKYERDLNEGSNEKFYINYWTSGIDFYSRIKARKIGKNKDTLLPNMNPILETLHNS